MIAWMAYWIWWMAWRVVVTLTCVFTIQHVIHEDEAIWIETKPLLIGALFFVLLIRIWSTPRPAKEKKCSTSVSFSSDT